MLSTNPKTVRIRGFFRNLSRDTVTTLPNPLKVPMIDIEDSPTTTERPHFESAADVAAFVTSGKAVFTVESVKTGKRFTYRVAKPFDKETGKVDHDATIAFAAALTGPDNTRDYSYFGNVRLSPNGNRYDYGRKAKIGQDAASVLAFAWFWQTVIAGQRLPDTLKVYHEGRCGRCGRALTVPASIRSGIGPECAKRSTMIADEGF